MQKLLDFKNSKEFISISNACIYNLINQLNFFRYEDMHTNLLKSLFESNNIYGLQTFHLKKFIELIKQKDNSKFKEIDIFEDYEINDVIVKPQVPITVGRLDLVIKFKIKEKSYVIILENKLLSVEGEEQCFKYEKECEEGLKKEFDEIIFVYLSLDNYTKISSDKFIRINYQELITNVLEPCSYKENNVPALTIKEYLRSFTYLYDLKLVFKKKNIPLITELKQYSIDLYNKYPETLEKILDNIKVKEDNEYKLFYKENKKQMDIIYITLFNTLKQNDFKNRIDRVLKDSKEKNVIKVKEILTELIKNNEDLTLVKYSPISNWKVYMTEEEYNDIYEPRRENYHLLNIENKPKYYYASPVTEEELKAFIKLVDNKYKKYNFKERYSEENE